MAAKKKTGTDVATLQAQIAKQAQEVGQSLGTGGGGNQIRITQQKQFVIDDTKTEGPIVLAILDFATQRRFYPGVYNANDIKPPECFAISEAASLQGRIDNMVPSDESFDVQSDDCTSCPMNQFKSAPNGVGKACRENRVLVVISPDVDPTESPLMTLRVSPTGLRGFDAYAKVLAASGKLPISVLTEVSFDGSTEYPTLLFKEVAVNGHLAEHYARIKEAQLMAVEPPDLTGGAAQGEAPQRPAKRATTKKKVARRRSA